MIRAYWCVVLMKRGGNECIDCPTWENAEGMCMALKASGFRAIVARRS